MDYWCSHKELKPTDDISGGTIGSYGNYESTTYYKCMTCGRKIKKHEKVEADQRGILKSTVTIEAT